MSIEFLGECVNVFFIINNVPDEAAVIVKVDRTYFWTVEEFLGNFVKETFPANEDGNVSLVVCFIFYLWIFYWDKIKVVFIYFLFCHRDSFHIFVNMIITVRI